MNKPISIAWIAFLGAALAIGCDRSESPTLGVQVDASSAASTRNAKTNDAQATPSEKSSVDGGTESKPAGAAEAGANAKPPFAPTPATPATGSSDAARQPAEVVHQAPLQVAQGGDGRARNVTFDAFKFPMDDPKSRIFERKMLPESIEKLDGTRIRIRGFILPGPFTEFSRFVLVRDNMECCFGPGAALYDSMMVELEEGETKFATRPITVEGTFVVREIVGPDKKHWSIYRIKATKVE